jgi:hypothetical protein
MTTATHTDTSQSANLSVFVSGIFSSAIRYIKDRKEHAEQRKTVALLNSLASSYDCVSPSMAKELRGFANGK